MAIQFNHTIVWSSNQSASAKFLAEMLGRPVPTRFDHFDVVELDNGVSLDFADAEGAIRPQHYAFLISEAEFDAAKALSGHIEVRLAMSLSGAKRTLAG